MPIVNVMQEHELKNAYIGEYQEKWQPWANTIAYYPLDTDFNDYSWNNRNLTASNATLTTLDWIKCTYLNSWYLRFTNSSTLISWQIRTFSIWIYKNTSYNGWLWWLNYYSNSYGDYWAWWLMINYAQGIVQFWDGIKNTTIWNLSTWWNNVIVAQNWATVKVYINWTLSWTVSDASTSWSWVNMNNITIWTKPSYAPSDAKLTGYVWETIVENKTRADQEAIDYYNQIKWNYGL
jgi:hypothetical protein